MQLLTGRDFWNTWPIEKIGLRRILVSDGPSGVRGETWDERDPSLNLPSATALASAWDPDIARRYGAAAAVEARRKGVDVVLGPTINLHRSPLSGRHFECFSEDPVLTADLAAAYVRGVQDNGVGATPKHYVANDSETDRFTVDVRVDERALRELYLLAFEKAITEAQRLAGDERLQLGQRRHRDRERPARDAAQQRVGLRRRRRQRLDRRPQPRQRPRRRRTWSCPARTARGATPWSRPSAAGDIDESVVDRKVLRILRLAAARRRPRRAPRRPSRCASRTAVAFAREAAVEGTVLLENRGELPLGRRRAALGRGDRRQRRQRPHPGRRQRDRAAGVHRLAARRACAPRCPAPRSPTRSARSCRTGLAELPLDQLTNPVTGEPGAAGPVPRRRRRRAVRRGPPQDAPLVWFGGDAPISRPRRRRADHPLHARPSSSTRPARLRHGRPRPGLRRRRAGHRRGPRGQSATDLGAAFLDAADRDDRRSRSTAGHAGRPPLRVRPRAPTRTSLAGALSLQFGTEPDADDHDALIAEAAEAAAAADVALVVVGTNSMVESEGFDRETLALPGRQDDLVPRRRRRQPAHGRARQRRLAGAAALARRRRGRAASATSAGRSSATPSPTCCSASPSPAAGCPPPGRATDEDVPVLSTAPRSTAALAYTEGIHIGYRAWLKARRHPGVLVRPRPRLHRHRRSPTSTAPAPARGRRGRHGAPSRSRTAASATASRSSRCTPSARTPPSTVRCAGSSATPRCGCRPGETRDRRRRRCRPGARLLGRRLDLRAGRLPLAGRHQRRRPAARHDRWSCTRMSQLAQPARPGLQPRPERGPASTASTTWRPRRSSTCRACRSTAAPTWSSGPTSATSRPGPSRWPSRTRPPAAASGRRRSATTTASSTSSSPSR